MIVLSVVALAVSAHAANTWYVDSGVSSSGNGQSWATAWKALSNIGGVSAGDTVYISGGPTGSSRAYSVSAWSPIGGSSSSPITYQIGQDSGASGHNGTAIFSGSGGFFGASPNNIIFSGDAGDNQMHFQFSGYSFVLGGTGAVNASNFRFSYVNLGTMNVTWDCFFFGTTTKIEVDHVYLYMTGANSWQCFELDLPSGTTWDDSKLHNLTLYVPSAGINQGMGVDGIYFGGNGVSVYSNFICGCSSAGYSGGQHGDGVQCVWGQYNKVYDNVIANMPNFGIYFEALMSDLENLQIYNNIVVNCTGGIIVGSEADATSWISSCTVANILIANNIVDATGNDQDISFGDLGSVPVVTYSNNELANNVVINGPYGIWLQNASPTMMNNVSLNSSQASSDYISFTASGTNNNYHLTAAGNTALSGGANFYSTFTTDRDGNARALSGAWEIGPYVYAAASLTSPPSITAQPVSLTNAIGGTANFSVTASGSGTLAYQWKFNTAPIGGATSSSYTISSVAASNAGSYQVTITNAYGSTNSSVATLTVILYPVISVQPASQAVGVGSNATLSVTANGVQPLSYQWRFNGTNRIAGATTNTYTITNAQTANSGSYTVVITNTAGSVTSAVAVVTVSVMAVRLNQNLDSVTAPALPSGWSSVVSGGGSGWTTVTSAYDTAPNSAYATDVATVGLSELVSPSVTLSNGTSVLSFNHDYNLEVDTTNSSLADDGGVLEMKVGSGAFTNITAAGGTWLAGGYNFTQISSAWGNAYSNQPCWSGNAGGFISSAVVLPSFTTNQTVQFRWTLATDSGNASTAVGWNVDTVSLVETNFSGGGVSNPPIITAQPISLVVGVGTNATFSVTASGTAPLAYQWRFNSGILSSATGSAYTITSATTNNAGTYTVIVTNSYGSAASSAAVLTVTNSLATNVPLPFIALTAPANSARYAAPATINLAATVTANGHTITKVQFYNGATLLAAATAAPYNFTWTNVSAGSYSLTARAVYDSGSTVASTAASVTVTNVTPPSIALTAPVNGASYAAPATINLAATVTANGHTITNVQSVQFYTSQDGWLATCISAPYTFTWTGVVAGSYSVTALVVDDSGNMVYSTAANVTVTNVPLPSIVLTSPVSGASYTLPATIPLAASVTANGYSITQVQFYNGATLLGAVVAAPYSFSWTNVIAGSYAVTARAVYNSGSTVSSAEANVTVAAAGRPAELTFAADSGTFSAPFVDSNGTLSQSVTTGVTNGGQAVYTFNIVNAGNYLVSAMVIAPSLSQNSFYVNIDAEPTDPLMIWDIPVCTNLTSRTVSWRGNGNSDPASSQYIPEVFTLSAGKHQLIIVGREADTTLGTISIAATPPTLKISSASGTAGLVQPGQPSPTLSATGRPGQTYNVLSSQDFVTWIFIGTVTLDASGSGQFTDPAGSTSRPICVYRLQGQ